jgi:tetratricopeptide (TPR) repeat protein
MIDKETHTRLARSGRPYSPWRTLAFRPRHGGFTTPPYDGAHGFPCRGLLLLFPLVVLFALAQDGHGQRVWKQDIGIVDLLEDLPEQEFFHGALPRFPFVEDLPTRDEDRLMPTERPDAPDQIRAERTKIALSTAVQLIRGEEWRRARLVLNDAVAMDPNHLHLLFYSALVSAHLKDYAMADHYYRRVLALNPGHLDALVGHVGVLLYTFRIPEAEALLAKGLEVDPDYLPLKYHQLMLSMTGEEQVGDDPFWNQRMFSHLQSMARWTLTDHENIINLLGERLFQRFCERIFGDGPAAQLPMLAAALQRYQEAKGLEQWDEAFTHLQALRDLGLTGLGMEMETAITDFETGRTGEGIDRMQRLAQRNPNHAAIWFNYGFMQLREGAYESAISALENALRSQDEMPRTRFALALARANLGQEEEAWRILFDLAREHPRLMIGWLDHHAPYMQVIRSHARYRTLAIQVGIPPQSL